LGYGIGIGRVEVVHTNGGGQGLPLLPLLSAIRNRRVSEMEMKGMDEGNMDMGIWGYGDEEDEGEECAMRCARINGGVQSSRV
jgi:hypothetical protein